MRLRTLLLAAPAVAVLLLAPAAQADWRGHGYGGHGGGYYGGHGGGYYGHGGYYGRGGGYYGGYPAGAAIVGGALLGLGIGAAVAGALAPPVYYAPPPVYYAPPAVVYAPPRVVYGPPAYYGW